LSGIRFRSPPTRVESRESAVSRFATATSRIAIETIESLKNARREVGDAASGVDSRLERAMDAAARP
jgi:hypothetical protein